MARSKSTTESAQFRAEAEKALAGEAPNDDRMATVARLRLVVEDLFGRPPESVVQPLHRAVEAFNWLGVLFECIEEANADGDRSNSSARIQALASLGAYVAGEYQVSVIGEPADEMQARIEAAQAGGAA